MPYKTKLLLFDRLSVRIFFTIWLSIAVMIILTALIPHFDQRRILSLSPKEEEVYYKRIVERMILRPHHRQRQQERGRYYLVVVPNHLEDRYRALHNITNDTFISFIIKTIPYENAHQQAVGKEVIVGPFHHPNNHDNHYYLISHAPPQAYYLSRLFDNPFLLIFLMTVISTPFVIILTRSLSKPMENLKHAAERVAKGDWTEDKSLETGPVEYRTLGRSFNRMVHALTSAEHEKNRLFANLSHELRTPLTRIRLSNSLIRRKSKDILSSEVKRIEENLILIENRIQAMLSLSKQVVLNRELLEKVDLQEILTPLLEDAAFEAQENNKTLNFPEIPNKIISVNLELFASGLENILRNAIYYAKSTISVDVRLQDNSLVIIISDDGCGIATHDIDKIFEAFYRGDRPDHIPDYGGSGLGLAIAKQMVDSHQGTISAENNNGLTVTIWLPLKE